jgi:N-acetylglucosamine kinase-like BadF-type ATPase
VQVYAGIDGGGTRARAMLLDAAGAERARVSGPAGIIDAADPARGAAVVAQLARDALAAADVAAPCEVLCCGLAGAGREVERQEVHRILEEAGVARRVLVLGDADVAMADAFGDGPGVLLIAGTGSIAWARAAGRPPLRVGGWGRLLGDEGSGYAIGLDALRHVVRAADGRAPTGLLTAEVLAGTRCSEVDELIRFADRATKAAIAALAPRVLACAAGGDAAAAAIRDDAVAALVELVRTAVSRAGMETPVVALAGGLLEPGGGLRTDLEAALEAEQPGCRIRPQPVDAARGAAGLALRAGTGP